MSKTSRIFYGNNEHQFGDLRLPEGEGPFPVAVIIHGGFWRSNRGLDLMDRVADDLTTRGIATWNIEYQRVGHQGGGWPGTFSDVSQAADYVYTLAESNNLDSNRVVPIGHSAGGHLGLLLAARKTAHTNGIKQEPLSIKGVISLAGVCDLELMWEVHHIHEMSVKRKSNPVSDFLGGSPDKVPQHYKEASPIELLPLGVPQVLIHGTLDIK